ncbi:MAG: PD-(D/E)XK nuclease family protein [Clostridiales bacterium]|jgi:ATP-dependent helicase/nuclease subunit B|nr:PD-(D/E)XK nuclease family protein [Clostridiales bacterium]
MITIHRSASVQGLLDGMITEIGRSLKASPESHHIIIVPDNIELYTELKLMEELRLLGTFNLEVASFTRLAKKYADLRGSLGDDGALMLLKRVVFETDDLLCFKKSAESDGFLKEAYALIKKIRVNRIDPAKLKLTDLPPKFRYKFEDILRLYHEYMRRLGEQKGDSLSHLERLCTELPKSAHITSSRIYIMLYDGFSRLQYDLIKGFFDNAVSVDIGVLGNDGAPNAEAYSAGSVYENLLLLADNARVVMHDARTKGVFRHIADRLFSYGNGERYDGGGHVRIFEAATPIDEVETAAAEINFLIDSAKITETAAENAEKDGAFGYSDIAVLVSDPDKYAPYLESVFRRYGIPHTGVRKKALSESAAIKYIRAAYDVLRRNFRLLHLTELIKNPYFPEEYARAEEFENLCIKTGAEYLTYTVRDEGAEALRQKAVAAVSRLKNLNGHVTAYGFTEILAGFFEDNGFEEKTEAYAQDPKNGADAVWFRLQSYQKIQNLLRGIERVFSHSELSLSEYLEIFLSSAEAVSISPEGEKLNVFIGSFSDGVFDKKALFLLGSSGGAFQKPFGSKLLSEREVALLASAGAVFDDEDSLAAAHTLSLLSAPTERLYLFYSASEGRPAEVVTELKGLLKEEETTDEPIDKTEQFLYRTSRRENLFPSLLKIADDGEAQNSGLIAAGFALLDAKDQKKFLRRTSEINVSNGDLRGGDGEISEGKALFFGKESIRVTQAEKYFTCPYLHFLTYGARLKERENGDLEARDAGNVMHEVLELFILPSKDMKKDEAARFAAESIKKVLAREKYAKLNTEKNRALKGRISSDVFRVCVDLHDFILHSDFKPYLSEAAIGAGGAFPPIRLAGGVSLTGKIDRIDREDNLVSVVDYKTGRVSGDVLSDAYYGTNLQLFLYLTALEKAGFAPAAALYLGLKDNFLKDEDNLYRYRAEGFVLNDAEVVQKLDNRIEGKSKILPVKSKDGEIVKGSDVLTREEFQKICTLCTQTVDLAVKEIADGNISKTPYRTSDKDACKYCPYTAVCAGRQRYRKRGKLKLEDFES